MGIKLWVPLKIQSNVPSLLGYKCNLLLNDPYIPGYDVSTKRQCPNFSTDYFNLQKGSRFIIEIAHIINNYRASKISNTETLFIASIL